VCIPDNRFALPGFNLPAFRGDFMRHFVAIGAFGSVSCRARANKRYRTVVARSVAVRGIF
jgi:hypothetical protein